MSGPLDSTKRHFVEITSLAHSHGGTGWEFGTCLWSPRTNASGADRYSIMRQPAAGDSVLHFLKNAWVDGVNESRLIGRSTVSRAVIETNDEPPMAGEWAKRGSYYRIDLIGYEEFSQPVPLSVFTSMYADEIARELDEESPRFYPFTRHGDTLRTVQGIYLAECTRRLLGIFGLALELQVVEGVDRLVAQVAYAEGKRLTREQTSFARNPALVKDAKALYGTKCQICGFDFAAFYGDVGDGYIEMHHLDELGLRVPSSQATSIDRVRVVCANCHRMLHRTVPAMDFDELRGRVS